MDYGAGKQNRLFKTFTSLWFNCAVVLVFVAGYFFRPISFAAVIFFSISICVNLYHKCWARAIVFGVMGTGAMCAYADLSTIILVCFAVFLCAGLMYSLNQKSYLFAIAVCLGFGISGVVVPLSGMFIVTGKDSQSLTQSYITQNADTINIKILGEIFYRIYDNDDYQKLSPTDKGYQSEVVQKFAKEAGYFAGEELFFFATWFASYASVLSSLLFLKMICPNIKEIKNANGEAVDESVKNLPEKTELIGCKVENFDILEARLNFKYIKYVFLPLLIFSFLGYIEALAPITSAIFNSIITVPAAFAAFLVLLYLASLPKRRSIKVCLLILVALVGLVGTFFSLAVLILSFVGLSDAILNIRRLTDIVTSND